ncbi:DUF3617 domain-containing protein [Massilia sp. PWRC2]|uniref:DUF3617 domain-containing protein n=1 Tax=Massilia sp. PWRC2 TaxID=2804626 RepID=UPI003CF72B22
MKSTLPLVIALSLGAACVSAAAVEPLFKPGLWEINNRPGGAGGSQMQAMLAAAQQQMSALDPARRAQVESMMSRNGVVIENGNVKAKVCITPAMAARQQLPVQQKGNCTSRFSPAGGQSINYAVSCTSPAATSEGTATFSSPTSYTATTRINAADAAGASMTVDSSGRWLSADCGAIAPIDVPG